LGGLKVEQKMTYFHALAPKTYIFRNEKKEWTFKCKGLNLSKLSQNMVIATYLALAESGSSLSE
jgi:hypothetical protein